jgi:hypothetical protein
MVYTAIDAKTLDKVLDDFADLVKEKVFKKFEYNKWKEFTSKFKGKCIEIEGDEFGIELHTNDRKSMLLNPRDDSLGAFIWEGLCLEELYVEVPDAFDKDFMTVKCKIASSEVDKNKRKIDLEKAIDLEKTAIKVLDINGDLVTVDPAYCTTQSTSSNCYPVKNYKINLYESEKENKTMKGFNFDFGPCSNDNIRMSMYGLAIQNNAGVWVSYNNGQVIDVDVMNFDGRQYMFKMPVAIKDIKVGDVVVHNRVPMFVTSIEDGIHVVDIRVGEAKTIVPTTNMFGFNFITKIVSMFDAFGVAPTADQPFGNMLPFMLMGDNKDIDPMMMFMMMNGSNLDMSNPMMMYFMFKDGNKGSDMLPMLMMMNQNKHECHCNHDHN